MDNEFDYLIIGGGSAGCALAGRLSEDPDTRVCLLEAGGKGDGLLVNVPAGAVAMLAKPVNNWLMETVPQKGLNGRQGFQPRGKCLGGSSAINAMVYIRGHREDYDQWAALGNKGWSYQDVLPYFRLSEGNERLRNDYHGNDGPLSVSDIRTDSPFHDYFLNAARECDIPITDDFNGEEQEGPGVFQVTQKNGERWSSARAYLFPHLNRPNLQVETLAQVQRIIVEDKRAVGVEFKQGNQTRTFRARKEVLLSAGAFQSPQLLMLSGIGDAEELKKLAKDLGIENRIELVKWRPLEEVPNAILECDIGIIPHQKHAHTDATIPHKLFQYMLGSRPVIVSNCKPLERIVRETQSGLVFESGNTKDLSSKIEKLFHHLQCI